MQEPPQLPQRPAFVPLPVQQLSYSAPLQQGRPGLVTAIGVMSIIVASLSILFSLQTGLQAVVFFSMSRLPGSTSTSSSTVIGTSSSGVVSMSTTVGSGGAAPTTAPGTSAALTPTEIQTVISKVQSSLGAKNLNVAQVTSLKAALQSPSQGLVAPGTAWSPVTSTTVQSDGTAKVTLSGGFIQIDSAGLVLSQFSSTSGMIGMPRIGLGPCILSLFDCVTSLGLAVMLLIAGITTLRYSPRALRLHRIYGWTKIPIAILGGIAYGWLMSGLMSSMPGAGGSMGNLFLWVYAGMIAALGSAYPIGLLIALRSKSVRGYYHSIIESGS